MFDPCQQWNPKWKDPQFAKWSRTHKQASHTGYRLLPLRGLRGRKEAIPWQVCVHSCEIHYLQNKIMHRNLSVERKACNVPCEAQHVFITLSAYSTHRFTPQQARCSKSLLSLPCRAFPLPNAAYPEKAVTRNIYLLKARKMQFFPRVYTAELYESTGE